MKKFFNQQKGWNCSYSTVYIVNSTVEEVVETAKEIYRDNLEYTCFNGKICDNGLISFETSRTSPESVAIIFSQHLKNANVYADTNWDYHEIYVYKNGEKYNNFSIRWAENRPEGYGDGSDMYYDCDLIITDFETNTEIPTGGGMCTEEEYEMYCNLIKTHKHNVQNDF